MATKQGPTVSGIGRPSAISRARLGLGASRLVGGGTGVESHGSPNGRSRRSITTQCMLPKQRLVPSEVVRSGPNGGLQTSDDDIHAAATAPARAQHASIHRLPSLVAKTASPPGRFSWILFIFVCRVVYLSIAMVLLFLVASRRDEDGARVPACRGLRLRLLLIAGLIQVGFRVTPPPPAAAACSDPENLSYKTGRVLAS